jgi:hypothetical protein
VGRHDKRRGPIWGGGETKPACALKSRAWRAKAHVGGATEEEASGAEEAWQHALKRETTEQARELSPGGVKGKMGVTPCVCVCVCLVAMVDRIRFGAGVGGLAYLGRLG